MNYTKLTLFLVAAGAVSAFADDTPWYYQANENNWSKGSDEKRPATTQRTAVPAPAVSQKKEQKATFSVEFVYGLATDDLYKEDDAKIDGIDTVGLRATLEGTPIFSTKNDFFTLTPFVSVDFGCGDDDSTLYTETIGSADWATYTYTDSVENDLVRFAAVIGLRARLNLSRYVALTAHVKAGVDCVYLSSTYADECHVVEAESRGGDNFSYYEDLTSDSAFAGGFCYGAGIGVEVNVSENWGLIANVEYFGSTAQPRLAFCNPYDSDYSFEVKADEQAYVMFSVGAAYRF